MAQTTIKEFTPAEKESLEKIIIARNAILKAKKDIAEVLGDKPTLKFWMFETDLWQIEETLQGIDKSLSYVVLGK